MIGAWHTQTQILGAFIRSRRKLARLSLRQLAEMTSLSNAYLSQLERGLHLPSVRVLKLLSEALNVSVETLLAQAGLLDLAPSGDGAAAADGPPASPVESAISAEERLAGEHGQLVLNEIPGVAKVQATLFQLVEDEQARLAREDR